MSKLISLTLLTKPGCHLCEEAKTVVDAVIERFRAENVLSVSFSEVNILDNRALVEKYGDEIPVLQINGSTHAYWRIDPERLERAIRRLLTK